MQTTLTIYNLTSVQKSQVSIQSGARERGDWPFRHLQVSLSIGNRALGTRPVVYNGNGQFSIDVCQQSACEDSTGIASPFKSLFQGARKGQKPSLSVNTLTLAGESFDGTPATDCLTPLPDSELPSPQSPSCMVCFLFLGGIPQRNATAVIAKLDCRHARGNVID